MTSSFVQFFKDKTVTLLGLGLLGRGIGDAAFLAQYCKRVLVTDMKSAEELKSSVDALSEFKNIDYFLGGHHLEQFKNVDFVIKGAGVRLDNPFVAEAKRNEIPVYMSTALFALLSPLKSIGVTGTRGKTTTTCMITEILKHAGKKILLGGNIRGVSTLEQLPDAHRYDVAVLELDSWQLQGFDDLGISPHISVFTNFYPDHMNYYDGDMAQYLKDKTAITRYQKSGDILVTTQATADLLGSLRAKSRASWIIAPELPKDFTLKIPGDHNRTNASLAKAASECFGIDPGTVRSALQKFSAVEGRLQQIGTSRGRTFYNDSNATTQDATLAALGAFPTDSVVLIFGGADKGLPIDAMLSFIECHKTRAVLIAGTGSDRVLKAMPALPVVSSMAEALKTAIQLSSENDNIVLSPAFASFGVFKNEYDRSDQFVAQVQNLVSGKTTWPV